MRLLSLLLRRRTSPITILCLLADPEDRGVMQSIARGNGLRLLCAGSPSDAEQTLRRVESPIVLIDRDIVGEPWREWLASLASQNEGACIILVSRRIDDSLWSEVVNSGGYETLAKPLQDAEV